MTDTLHIEGILRRRYPDLETVGEHIFRGVDRYAERDYAVRYFDLNDNLTDIAPNIKSYQEQMLSGMYFSAKTATNLRWNHYLYFITSIEKTKSDDFKHWKTIVEEDREYARKQVILEAELIALLAQQKPAKATSSMPIDLTSTLMKQLDEKGLGFILDEAITVPEAVRQIQSGQRKNASKVLSPIKLLNYEKAATNHYLKSLTIQGFRPHPLEKNHQFGRVNLISGINGVGKTSLLEAIEYAYCGKNRRKGIVGKNTSVVCDLDGSPEKLVSSTLPERQRGRNAHWYAKTDILKVTIEDSFGKFNFLDTDAAVRLSVANTSGMIGEEISRLMLGAEAEKLNDRLYRVKEKVEEEQRVQNTILEDQNDNLLSAKIRLDAITKAPMQSDSLYSEFLIILKHVEWKHAPANKDSIQGLRSSLQLAATSVALLQKSKFDLLHSDEEHLQQLETELNTSVEMAESLDAQHRSATLELAELQRKTQMTRVKNSAIDALLTYAHANFQELLLKSQTLQKSINTKSARLGTFKTFSITEQIEEYSNHPTVSAVELGLARLVQLKKHLNQATYSLNAFEKTQSDLTLLRQRLTSTVQELLPSMPNPDHCPVCHTQFEQGQLMSRMLADNISDVSEQMNHLQAEIIKTQNEISVMEITDFALQSLVHFVGNDSGTITVAEALSMLNQERITLDQEVTQLSILQEQLAQLHENGLSTNHLSHTLINANLPTLPSVVELQALQSNSHNDLKGLQDKLKETQDKLLKVQQKLEVMATSYSLETTSTTDQIVRKALSELASFETSRESRSDLLELININSTTKIENLSINLASAQELLVKIVTAVDQEKYNSESLTKETKTIHSLNHLITESRVKIARLNDAFILLKILVKQSSGGELTTKILSENADEIGRTFSSIHMPNEFELNAVNGKFKIIRQQTGKEVELHEMSTGQRAAFALSLFISMNARLQKGPPVLLFDDPVAHVDDINVLSFLDYLRDVAIRGERQIFYATADTKLAGLFRHKFQFLGSDQFKEISLTREEGLKP